jgi:hypothetical protein
VKTVNKLLQNDLELLRDSLEKLNAQCTNNGKNDKMPKRLKVSKEERKSDSKVNYPMLEYIPVIINRISESDIRNGSKIDQSYKTKIKKLLLMNEIFGKENQKEKREFHLTNNKKNKILIIGDSHARGYASNLSSHFGKEDSGLENIIKMNIKGIRALGKKDIMIVSGGAMDINKNEAKMGLRQLRNLVSNIQNTNTLIITVPHRHDLQESSCLNKEIYFFNRNHKKS